MRTSSKTPKANAPAQQNNTLDIRAKVGGTILIVVVISTLLSIFWTPYPPLAMSTGPSLGHISLAHPLGTDVYGRDTLSRLMTGGVPVFESCFLSLVVAVPFGVTLGVVASWYQHRAIDAIISLFTDALYGFPALLLAITFVSVFGASTLVAGISVGVALIPSFVRVVKVRSQEVLGRGFITVSRTYGLSRRTITLRHVLPNLSASILSQTILGASLTVLATAALSYLGLGTPPPTPSWGVMIEEAQSYVAIDPTLMIVPALMVAATIFGLNVLADFYSALRKDG